MVRTQQGEYQVIDTVLGRTVHFLKPKIGGAAHIIRSLAMTGRTTQSNLQAVVRLNAVKNLGITVVNMDNTLKVSRPDLAGLRGWATQDEPVGIRSDYVSVPAGI